MDVARVYFEGMGVNKSRLVGFAITRFISFIDSAWICFVVSFYNRKYNSNFFSIGSLSI